MSGVHFAVHVKAAGGGLLLCPFISLLLKDGQEVGLVGDTLGPVPLTDDFLVDFAAVDQGLQKFEGKSTTEKPHDWTLRTCLRDYTSFNNRGPKQIYLSSSSDACQVHLQNLVASEEACGTPPIGTTPSWVQMKERCGEATNDGPIIFEGTAEALVVGETQRQTSRSADFWHHMVFDMVHGRASPSGALEKTQGEFWMSKRAMNMQPLYIYCKLTVAQATVSCISLRFSCQKDYLDMLQMLGTRNTPTTLQFKYPHIPSRGVIMGVEQDPRNPRLIRMFIEYRNEILEDMILCEIDPAQEAWCLGEWVKACNSRRPKPRGMATSAGSRLFLYTGVPFKESTAEAQTSQGGMLQKPGFKEPPVVWTQPLVESVAVVSDWPDGFTPRQTHRCCRYFSQPREFLTFQSLQVRNLIWVQRGTVIV
eukprot:s922_g31.t1